MSDDFSIWDVFVSMFWFMLLFAWIMLLFHIIADIFRDRELSGFAKAMWCLFLIFIPWVGALVYLIVRGNSMTQRSVEAAKENEANMRAYVRDAAGTTSAADELPSSRRCATAARSRRRTTRGRRRRFSPDPRPGRTQGVGPTSPTRQARVVAVNLPTDDLTALAERVSGLVHRPVHASVHPDGGLRSFAGARLPGLHRADPVAHRHRGAGSRGRPGADRPDDHHQVRPHRHLGGLRSNSSSRSPVSPRAPPASPARLLLIYSGVSFTRRMSKMYRAAWNQQKAGVRGNLFAALGLFVLVGEVLIVYWIAALAKNLPLDWVIAIPLSILTGLVPWTSVPYLLMNRQVHWRRLLVGGALTSTAMAIFGMATTLYMPDLIDQHTSQFGLFGVTIAIIGWLLGAAVITVASTAIAAEFDRSRAPWAIHLKDRYRLQDPAIPSPGPSTDEALGLTGADLLLFGRVLVNWLVTATAVWAATVLVPGINVNGGVLTYLWVSLLFGLVNALLGPLLGLFVPNVTWPRLGLVALGVNGVLLEVTSWVTANLDIDGLVSSVLGALVISSPSRCASSPCALRPFTRAG